MNKQMLICPECEEGELVAGVRDLEFSYSGRPLRVSALECYRCQSCGTETVKPDQIRRNETRIADAKRNLDQLLSGEEIRRVREALGLSQPEAAKIFGGGANGFSKYERGQTVQSVPMDRLLRVAAAYPWIVEFLRFQSGGMSKARAGDYIDVSAVSLNDPQYKSKPVTGEAVIASPITRECVVVSLSDWNKRKVA